MSTFINCKPQSIITYNPKINHFQNYTNDAVTSWTNSLAPFGWLCDTILLTTYKTHKREEGWKQSAHCEPPQSSCTYSFLCSDLLWCICLYLSVFVLFLIKMSEKSRSTSIKKPARGNQYLREIKHMKCTYSSSICHSLGLATSTACIICDNAGIIKKLSTKELKWRL